MATPLSPADVAALLGKDVETVRRWLRRGKLPHTKTPGGEYLIDRAAAHALLPGPRTETRLREEIDAM